MTLLLWMMDLLRNSIGHNTYEPLKLSLGEHVIFDLILTEAHNGTQ